MTAARFPFLDANPSQPGASLMPLLPLVLSRGRNQTDGIGLLDTGAALNVLPFSLGERLGFDWNQEKTPVVLSGNLADISAKAIVVTATIASFKPILLVFAWTQTNDARLILGQMNFFLEFDACFFRNQTAFEIKPKPTP